MTDWVQGLGLLTTNGTQKTLPSAVESKKMVVIYVYSAAESKNNLEYKLDPNDEYPITKGLVRS